MLWWEEDGIREKEMFVYCVGFFCFAPWLLNSSVGRTGCRIREKNVFVFFAVPSSALVLQGALCRREGSETGCREGWKNEVWLEHSRGRTA